MVGIKAREEVEVYRLIENQVPEWFGESARLQSMQPAIRHLERSFIARYTIKIGSNVHTAVLLKVPCVNGAGNFEEALSLQEPRTSTRNEYEILVAVHDRISAAEPGNICAIRPLAYFPQWNAIATEELDGVSLASKILRLPFGSLINVKTMNELIRRSGEWLRFFHDEIGSFSHEHAAQTELEIELDEKISQLRHYNNSETSLNQIRSIVMPAIQNAGSNFVRFVQLHGDFKASNILVDKHGRVAAFDSKMRNRGPLYMDLSKLYSDLIADRFAVLTAGVMNQRKKWKQSLLSGYFQNEPHDEALFHVYAAFALLDKWILDEKKAEKIPVGKKAARLWYRKYFLALLARVISIFFLGVSAVNSYCL